MPSNHSSTSTAFSELLSSDMESPEGFEVLPQPRRPNIFFRPLLLIFCLILLQLDLCLSGNTISAGNSITGNQTITSKGGIFELGYFSLGSPARYYIGIWYKDVTNDNVVWVANRDMPLQNNTAELKISKDGSNLVIQTKSGSLVWSTNLAPITASSHPPRVAVLLDSGNLVLRDANSSSGATMWESFDHPTDTFLPHGRLGVNKVTKQNIAITSWKSKDDPSSGLFSQKINPNGDLELPLFWNNTHAYWTTGVWDGQYFSRMPEMRSISYLYNSSFIVNENVSYYTYWLYDSSTPTWIKIDVNGQIKQATWTKATGSWTVIWARPSDQCDVYALCGAFGVCNSQSHQKICQCLDGFEPASAEEWNSNAWSGGCMRKTKLQCEGDQFTKLSIISSPNYPTSNSTNGTVDSCRLACLNDCSCTAYSFQDGGCSAWKDNVLNLVEGTIDSGPHSIFVRVAGSPKSGGGKKHSQSVIIAVTVTSLLILLAAAGACYFSKAKAGKAGARKQGDATRMIQLGQARKESGGPDLAFYRLRDIMAATDNLSESNKLGQGGFGPVYRGKLRGGQEVAIKRLSRSSNQGLEEFMNELMLIAKLKHTNLVQLVGCCTEGEERILVYEYMPNKSLDHFLFDPILSKQLDWEKRFEIVMGIARGLQYLHQESRLKVIHRDLKTSNILLDAVMNPRISDFGLARIFCDERSHISTIKIAGTCGYMPPEYALEGRYSTKSDVFSFGVILLEIVSGLRMTSFCNKQYCLNLLGHVSFQSPSTANRGSCFTSTCIELLDAIFMICSLPTPIMVGLLRKHAGHEVPQIYRCLYMSMRSISRLFTRFLNQFPYALGKTYRWSWKAGSYRGSRIVELVKARDCLWDPYLPPFTAWKLWNEDKVAELLDHSLEMPHKLEQVLRCINVGLLCVQEDAAERPTMSSVVTMLSNDSANLASPKQPAYSRRARSPDGGSTPAEFELGNSSTNSISFSALQPR